MIGIGYHFSYLLNGIIGGEKHIINVSIYRKEVPLNHFIIHFSKLRTYRPYNSFEFRCFSAIFCSQSHMNILAKVKVNADPIAPPLICR